LKRGYAFSMKKDYDSAIRDYDETIRLDPNNALAHFCRGSAWDAKRDYRKAREDWGGAHRLDPGAFPPPS
jgi:tetratricopeptide (TPR) repeat protein